MIKRELISKYISKRQEIQKRAKKLGISDSDYLKLLKALDKKR